MVPFLEEVNFFALLFKDAVSPCTSTVRPHGLVDRAVDFESEKGVMVLRGLGNLLWLENEYLVLW